jgi:release factor glutamine methyltransferase
VAWITGFKEFLGMDFAVKPGLLVPRADTETLVEAALEVLSTGPCRVVDVCTGTGCVAVGLAALAPDRHEVWACDLSSLAVETARQNAASLLDRGRSVTVVASNLMASLTGTWDLIVSNPPYLTPEETRQRVDGGGWREPALALDGGGSDGLDLIRTLVGEAQSTLNPGGWLLIEAADAQMDAIEGLLLEAGLEKHRFWKDLGGQRRVAGARKHPT